MSEVPAPPAVPRAAAPARVRPAAVAGQFYPGDAARLHADIAHLLEQAADQRYAPAPKAIIAPHAGYVYSGDTAARAYARLIARRGAIRRVVLLGPAHRVPVRGIALPEAEAFDTPLGTVAIDQQALRAIGHLRQIVPARAVHAAEHALEVHLPFLQAVLGDFLLVPLVVGDVTASMVAEVLDLLWGGEETLIVVSSDLSHYQPYRDAVQRDDATVAAILDGSINIRHEQACGATPVNALMQVARARRLRIELIDQCNSGDTAGPRDRVVGYASFALYEASGAASHAVPEFSQDASIIRLESRSGSDSSRHGSGALVPQGFPADAGAKLTGLARAAIASALRASAMDAAFVAPVSSDDWLDRPAASFVTLTRAGALRGCIGSLQAHRPLRDDVSANAQAAALRDPRFAPVTADEWPQIRVDVSVLTPAVAMAVMDEADAIAQLRPLIDGVILEAGTHRATFLPQVWEQIPEPHAFLAALKQKAGLPPAYWGAHLRLWRYSVTKFAE